MSDDSTEFLLARIAEDEQVARDAAGVPWSAHVPGMIHVDAEVIRANKHAYGQLGYVATVEREGNRAHIARWDPARVLAECEAKRRIVELHESVPHYLGTYCRECGDLDNAGDPIPYWPCQTLQLLVLPYRQHPDYRPEWAPEP